jgi:hypothetical protein
MTEGNYDFKNFMQRAKPQKHELKLTEKSYMKGFGKIPLPKHKETFHSYDIEEEKNLPLEDILENPCKDIELPNYSMIGPRFSPFTDKELNLKTATITPEHNVIYEGNIYSMDEFIEFLEIQNPIRAGIESKEINPKDFGDVLRNLTNPCSEITIGKSETAKLKVPEDAGEFIEQAEKHAQQIEDFNNFKAQLQKDFPETKDFKFEQLQKSYFLKKQFQTDYPIIMGAISKGEESFRTLLMQEQYKLEMHWMSKDTEDQYYFSDSQRNNGIYIDRSVAGRLLGRRKDTYELGKLIVSRDSLSRRIRADINLDEFIWGDKPLSKESFQRLIDNYVSARLPTSEEVENALKYVDQEDYHLENDFPSQTHPNPKD